MAFIDTLAKYFLFASNTLIFILSWIIMSLGIWALVNRSSFLDLLSDADVSVPIYESAVILFLFVASCSILISCLGCCGAHRESKWMLIVYFVVVLGLLILIMVATIIGMTQGTDRLAQPLLDTLSQYDQTQNRAVEITWDQTQKDLQCCGVHSFADWAVHNERYGPNSAIEDGDTYLLRAMVPPSCCDKASVVTACQRAPSGHSGAYVQGCWALIEGEVNKHIDTVGGVAISIIVILTVNMVIAFYMCACGVDSNSDERPRKAGYGRPGGRV